MSGLMRTALAVAGLALGTAISVEGYGYGEPKPPFDPRINRWTGEPHKHRREIARRLRARAAGEGA